jgi:DNA-binding response OmpR family regulator
MRVLLIEDEARLAGNVAAALREGPGFAVDCAEDGETGASLAGNHCYDLIILDLMLPRLNGVAVLQHIRAQKDHTPVLVLTARGEVLSKINLLNAGADDYLSKPFDLGELLARAKALIRRGKGVAHPTLQVGELIVNTLEQTVTKAGEPVNLSPMEYRILEYLMHRPRMVISKQELLEHLYDYNW